MSIEDFTERRQLRERETVEKLRECIPDSWLGYRGPLSAEQEKDLIAYCRYIRDNIRTEGPIPTTPDELRRAARALERYRRHTDEVAPAHTDDEMLAFEKGWRRAKVAWVVLLVLVAGYVVWRLVK